MKGHFPEIANKGIAVMNLSVYIYDIQLTIYMKNHHPATQAFTKRGKRVRLLFQAILASLLLAVSNPVQAQALAVWGFNGNNNGTAGTYNSLYPAVFSPAVTGPAYNSTVFFGEGVWPSGGLDLAWYFEFGLAPLSGNSLNITSLAITMRRSSTGSSGGGPNNWTLRSSIDGYTADLASGSLTTSAITYNVNTGSTFLGLVAGQRFRIYGYNASLSSGALSRLVMENLQVNGIGFILPARILNFGTMLRGKDIRINYRVSNDETGTAFAVERSLDGTSYKEINRYVPAGQDDEFTQEVTDASGPLSGRVVYYRLKMEYPSGQKVYSSVSAVDLSQVQVQSMAITQQGSTLLVRTTVSGTRDLYLYNSAGQLLRHLQQSPDNALLSLAVDGVQPGIYIVRVQNARVAESATVYLR